MGNITKICFIGGGSSFIKNDKRILEELGYHINAHHFNSRDMKYRKYWYEIKKAVKNSDAVFGWFASWETLPAVYYAKKYNIPSMIVTGGYDVANCHDIDYGAFTNIKERVPAKYILKHATKLLAVSYWNNYEILNRINSKDIDEHISVAYNGIDLKHFQYDRTKKKENLVITVCHINSSNIIRKGLKTFIEVARRLPNIEFAIIGKVIDYHFPNIPKNVIFTGFVSNKELLDYYQKAKVICQLSYYESFGLAPLEGMACGCVPVVTKERVGMPEFIGDIGFYVNYGDVEETAKQIKNAIQVEERNKFVLQASNFSLEKRKEKLIDIYSKVLKK